jgi:nicotinamidase-related amidase
MALYASGLLKEMQRWNGYGTHRVALVIIDEQRRTDELATPASDVTRNQQTVIMGARNMGIPIWCVELCPPGIDPALRPPTRTRLRAMLPPGVHILVKTGFNAFNDTEFEAQLRQSRITAIAIMGRQTNHCVHRTAVGGSERSDGTGFVNGATQRGFYVLTSQHVLQDEEAHWVDSPSVYFYTGL